MAAEEKFRPHRASSAVGLKGKKGPYYPTPSTICAPSTSKVYGSTT